VIGRDETAKGEDVIIVARQWIASVEDLSGKFRNLVGLVADGPAWLQWALLERQLVMEAEDESDLLTKVQAGLHSTPLMTVETLNLAVHPRRLMQLDDDIVTQLAKAVSTGNGADIKAAWKLLTPAGILSFVDLEDGRDFLGRLDVNDASLFAALDLEDLVDLTALAQVDSKLLPSEKNGLSHKAAAFAVTQSQSCAEFCDAYGFFCRNATAGKGQAKTGSAELVAKLWERLSPLVNGTLQTMTVGRFTSDEGLCAQIETSVYNGKPLGFATKPRALRILSAHIDASCDNREWRKAVRDALMDARCMIRHGKARDVSLSQDGARHSVEYVSDKASLILDCNAEGLVTIADYHP